MKLSSQNDPGNETQKCTPSYGGTQTQKASQVLTGPFDKNRMNHPFTAVFSLFMV